MRHSHRSTVLLCMIPAILFLAACSESPDAEPEVIADLGGLAEGWNTIETGDETICSDGSAYKFFVRPGAPERVVVYLQGGGGCWSGSNCDPDLQPSYTINLDDLDPSTRGGILAFDNTENPFADHSVVFAPYCTADVHIGDSVATYEAPTTDEHEGHEVTIHHKGAVNIDAVLDWTYAHFLKPDSIFVTGSSAGSIPSPYYAIVLADHYSDALVSQLGDAAGGYRGIGSDTRPHERWGTMAVLAKYPEFAEMQSEDFTFESLYITAAKRHPEITFAEYDTAEDSVQLMFLELANLPATSLLELLDANQADIRAEAANFRSYIAGGDVHTILLRPEFYTYHVSGVRVRDWVASLAAGEEVEDVRCSDCSAPEVLETETPKSDESEATG